MGKNKYIVRNRLLRMLIYLKFVIITDKSCMILSYTINCDYMGECTFSDKTNKNINFNSGYIPLYKEHNTNNISKQWNDTFYLLKLDKQIDGISNYGLLKGTKSGYECSGGLWECKDSCCLDGFCVEILFFCDRESDFVSNVYLGISLFFLVLISLYWVTFLILGCKYQEDLSKTKKEES